MRRPALAVVSVMCLLVCAAAPARAEGDDLSGRWVMLLQTTTAAEVPVVGKVRSVTTAVILYDLQQDGDRLVGEGELCALSIDSGTRLVRTVLPPAFVRSQPRPRLDAALKRRGDEVRLEQRRAWVVLGAKLEDERADALPVSPDDPRVWDQDGDGLPGVTVRIEGLVDGEVYVAQRSWSDLVGEVRGADEIAGRVRFDQEQVVLGATSALLEDPPAATPELARSGFWLWRLPAGAVCAEARSRAQAKR